MKFISYAQNLEDVMLWRALSNVKNGFYIDVGASDPNVDSVTKVFYQAGWHGINIEPMPAQYFDLARERLRDINLQCAVGSENSTIEIWECDVRGWATASADVVAHHKAGGHSGIVHTVQVYRLADLCSKYVDGQIHFLKIDVEGFEKAVIHGMDFSCFRPWIMVIEAIRPNSSEEVYMEWEGEVLANGYLFVYADGLNRFYVAAEHRELIDAFRFPPNVFDDYILSAHVNSDFKAQEAESRAQEAESRAQEAESRAQEAQEILALIKSLVWRATAPLRHLVNAGRNVYRRSRRALFFKANCLAGRFMQFTKSSPRFRKHAIKASKRFPPLYRYMQYINFKRFRDEAVVSSFQSDYESLTPRARQIHLEITQLMQSTKNQG